MKHSDQDPIGLYYNIFSLSAFLVVMVSQSFLYSLVVIVNSVKVTVAWLFLFYFPPALLSVTKKVQK